MQALPPEELFSLAYRLTGSPTHRMHAALKMTVAAPADTPLVHPTPTPLAQTRLDMIAAAGRFCHLVGLPRLVGRIYGFPYLSSRPLNFDDIAAALGIAKSSAKWGTRQLVGLRVIKQLWIHGDRRDHFEADPDLGNILRAGYNEFLKPRLGSTHQRLDRMTTGLDEDLATGNITQEDYDFCAKRLTRFRNLQERFHALLPLMDQLL